MSTCQHLELCLLLNTLNEHTEDEGQEYFVIYYVISLKNIVIVFKMCLAWAFFLLTEIYEVNPTGCDRKKKIRK